jgi:hypothetical protein
VGHSSASVLAVELAVQISAGAIIVVDGEVPPVHGPASPVRPALRELIRSLALSDGRLPVWSRWFEESAERKTLVGLDQLAKDADAFAILKVNSLDTPLTGSMTPLILGAGNTFLAVMS